MELLVQEEGKELSETLKKLEGKPMTTQHKFNAAVLNALWSIVTGKRHAQDDPVLGDLIKRLTRFVEKWNNYTFVDFPFSKTCEEFFLLYYLLIHTVVYRSLDDLPKFLCFSHPSLENFRS